MERNQFLNTVSAAVMKAEIPAPPAVPERLTDLPPADLVALFRQRARSVDAVVHGPVGRHGVPRAVAGVAAGHDSKTFAAWETLPVPGIPAALRALGITRVETTVSNENRRSDQMRYEDLDLGITGCDGGLAESGSVILQHGDGRSRMVSLIPEVHVVLLDVADLDRNLARWAARHPLAASETTNLVVVTGPSRTGDIEMNLTLGVHGPRHLHIVLVK